MRKKVLSILLTLCLLLGLMPTAALAAGPTGAGTESDPYIYKAASVDELSDAVADIRSKGAGHYVISLTGEIDGAAGMSFATENMTVTLLGNGYSIQMRKGNCLSVTGGATLRLGNEEKNGLTIKGPNTYNNDNPGLLYVQTGGTCSMYDGVTLQDNKGNNYFGGGVTVAGGTFHMFGGTIQNCGIDGGSVCYGGGVAVVYGGSFIMDGGTITDCYVTSGYIDNYDANRCLTAMGGGVFVSGGSYFEMNGGTISKNRATNMGGGVALTSSYEEGANGYLKSAFLLNDGTISENTAQYGAGVFASGYYYAYAVGLCASTPNIGNQEKPGLYIEGGTISNNEATNDGGGVMVAMIRSQYQTEIKNAFIKENAAKNGAGVEIYGYWTQAGIDGCTITGNTASNRGGGLDLKNNSSGNGTMLKNTTITGNTVSDANGIGAGVYYDANSKLTISGKNTIQDNKTNGVLNNLNILSSDKPIYIGGALAGSQIGLTDPILWTDSKTDDDETAVSAEFLTNGYDATNGSKPNNPPAQYFTSDHAGWAAQYGAKTDPTYKEGWVDVSWRGIKKNDYVRGNDFTYQNLRYNPETKTILPSTASKSDSYPLAFIYSDDTGCCWLAYKDGNNYKLIAELTGTTKDSRSTTVPAGLRLDSTLSNITTLGCGNFANNISSTEKVQQLGQSIDTPGTDYTSEVRLVRQHMFTVTFDPNEGTLVDGTVNPVSVPGGELVSKPAEPTRSGYTFTGWTLDGAVFDFSTPVTQDITLVAQWSKNNPGGGGSGGGSVTRYTLTYESNGGTEYPRETYSSGRTVTLDKVPTREGYSFTGWYSDKGMTNKITSVTMTSNKTVYAGWLFIGDLNAKDHVAYVYGYNDGTVGPNRNTTRAETAVMLYRLLTPERSAEITTTDNSFSDVPTTVWYCKEVSSMANGGYVIGYRDGTFGGDKSITRAEFVTMMVRFINPAEGTKTFTDVPETYWAYQSISTATAAGWIAGYSDGSFGPEKPITRAEVMTIINRVLNRGVDEDSELLDFKQWPDNKPSDWFYYDVIEATNSHEYTGSRPSENWTKILK